MQEFDPASVAELQASVAARCIAFSLTAASTEQPYIDHAVAPGVRPVGSAPHVLLTATATYRTPGAVLTDAQGLPSPPQVVYAGVQAQPFGPAGCQVICDASNQTVATGLLLQWLNAQFDLFDLRNPVQATPARVP
jgi:hypothetical protein